MAELSLHGYDTVLKEVTQMSDEKLRGHQETLHGILLNAQAKDIGRQASEAMRFLAYVEFELGQRTTGETEVGAERGLELVSV